jgi:hypothetical protein
LILYAVFTLRVAITVVVLNVTFGACFGVSALGAAFTTPSAVVIFILEEQNTITLFACFQNFKVFSKYFLA